MNEHNYNCGCTDKSPDGPLICLYHVAYEDGRKAGLEEGVNIFEKRAPDLYDLTNKTSPVTELKIDEKRKAAMLEGIDHFRKSVDNGEVKEFMIIASEGRQWKTWYNFTSNFVTRTGAIFNLLLHACGVNFEKE